MIGQTNHQTEARCLKFIGPAEANKNTKKSSDARLESTRYEPESSLPVVSRNRDTGHGAQPANKKSAEGDKNIMKDLTMVLLAAAMERCQKLVPHVRSLPTQNVPQANGVRTHADPSRWVPLQRVCVVGNSRKCMKGTI
ncbi:hypothetical protein T07_644 [Trichinella nelsoni]|uniref:Uncharacterized protein n=1 Tax=Trichinella nelsoni TaxID=6336 RepID=A0A0V0S318_9BILA|nr:hypothetical protein T07_644 [Trichinella nelsoni]